MPLFRFNPKILNGYPIKPLPALPSPIESVSANVYGVKVAPAQKLLTDFF
jgi:hypothetical protein